MSPGLDRRQFVALLIPCVLLAASFGAEPYLTSTNVRSDPIDLESEQPQFLFRINDFSVYYVGVDLFYPRNGSAYQAIVFDLPAAAQGPGSDRSAPSRWIAQASQALALLNGIAEPLAEYAATERDRLISQDFRQQAYAEKLRRGDAWYYELPGDAGYRRAFGVRGLIAIGAQQPADARRRADDTLTAALGQAFAECRRHDVDGVAIPFIDRSSAGEPLGRDESWAAIIQTVSRLGPRSGVKSAWIGGRRFGEIASGQPQPDRAFASAFSRVAADIQTQPASPVHEEIRMTSLAYLAAAGRLVLRRQRKLAWRDLALLALGAASSAVAVSTLVDWSLPLLAGMVSDGLVLAIKALLSIIAGYFMVEIARLKRTELTV